MTQITIVRMSNCKLSWTSEGHRRGGLPEGHPTTLYGVWQDQRIIMLCSSYDDAAMFGELEADRLSVALVDLASGDMRPSSDDDWTGLPNV